MINEITFFEQIAQGLMPNVKVWNIIQYHLLIISAKGIHGYSDGFVTPSIKLLQHSWLHVILSALQRIR
jgi:hypothetical protein